MIQITHLSAQEKKENAEAPTPSYDTNTNQIKRAVHWHRDLLLCASLHLSLVSANSAKACYQFEMICAAKGKTR